MLSVRCLSVCLSVCNVGVLWPNIWMDQDETWHAGRPRPWPHCVRWGPRSLSPKGTAPNFRLVSVVAKWLYGSRCHLVGRYASTEATPSNPQNDRLYASAKTKKKASQQSLIAHNHQRSASRWCCQLAGQNPLYRCRGLTPVWYVQINVTVVVMGNS